MVTMTEDDVRKMLKAQIKQVGSQRKLAKEIGISVAYLSDILANKRHPGPSIAEYYNLVIEVIYKRKYMFRRNK